MEKRFSEMSEFELKQLIGQLNEKAKKAEQLGIVNEFAVYERKIAIAKAYLLNPDDFKPGEIYHIEHDMDATFEIDYLNGIFAWGYRIENGVKKEEALPISLLKKQ